MIPFCYCCYLLTLGKHAHYCDKKKETSHTLAKWCSFLIQSSTKSDLIPTSFGTCENIFLKIVRNSSLSAN